MRSRYGRRAFRASPIRCVGERIKATGVPEFREVAWRACITLAVTDFPSMFVFYQALGLPVHKLGKDPERPFAMFAMGSLILALYPKALLAKQAGCTIEGDNSALSLSLNVADKSEVNVTLELALAHGARITRTPFQPEWGGYCGYFKDPEANLWEVVWHEKYHHQPEFANL